MPRRKSTAKLKPVEGKKGKNSQPGRPSTAKSRNENKKQQKTTQASNKQQKNAKRKSSSSSVTPNQNRPQKRRRRTRVSSESSEDEGMILTVPAKQMAVWKPVSKDSVAFVTQIVETNMNQIMSRNRSLSLEAVQQCFHTFKGRLQTKMTKLKGPVNTKGSYNRLQIVKKAIEVNIRDCTDHKEELDAEYERYESLIEKLEREKLALERDGEADSLSESGSEGGDTLGLPPLPADSLQLMGLQSKPKGQPTSNKNREVIEVLSELTDGATLTSQPTPAQIE